MQSELTHARALFDRQDFFAAHEAFEDLWRAATGDDKATLKALTQVAVALHHHSTGNRAGARSVLARAAHGLAHAPPSFHGMDVRRLCRELDHWQRYLAGDAPRPPFPQL